MNNVLIVEDNTELSGSLADYLSEVGFEVDFAFNGKSCLELLSANEYDVIIMDIKMPIKDGLTTCREIRSVYHMDTPILFLTARDNLDDKVAGFSAGGDDYVVKPFSPEELVCRLNALLKRTKLPAASRQILGELTIDHGLQQVYRNDILIDLHEIQFKILAILARSAPNPVSRTVLEDSVWPDGPPESEPLRTHIYRLRKKLDTPFSQALIKTQHGKGYRLAIPQ